MAWDIRGTCRRARDALEVENPDGCERGARGLDRFCERELENDELVTR
jgi:hypothetical protein